MIFKGLNIIIGLSIILMARLCNWDPINVRTMEIVIDIQPKTGKDTMIIYKSKYHDKVVGIYGYALHGVEKKKSKDLDLQNIFQEVVSRYDSISIIQAETGKKKIWRKIDSSYLGHNFYNPEAWDSSSLPWKFVITNKDLE